MAWAYATQHGLHKNTCMHVHLHACRNIPLPPLVFNMMTTTIPTITAMHAFYMYVCACVCV